MNSSRAPHSRRRFLRETSIATASAVVGFPALLRSASPNEKLNIAVIGCGGRGGGNLAEVSGENIVALCDVNERPLDAAAAKHPKARKFIDFRKLYDEARDFDAVVVSCAEHTHAFATLPALQLGKHVYCEKPLTHSIWEARIITEAARRAKVATQMGTQIHASANYRRVVELVQGGAIGSVREAHVWVGRAWGLQSEEAAKRHKDIVLVAERPKQTSPVPAGLHWDLWLGPAPERPFHEVYFPGPKWYRWWDFGGGTMSDLGSHWNDLPFWALKLQAPLTIEASGPPPHPEIAPASMTAAYEYGPRGGMPAVKLTWHQGEEKPALLREGKIPKWDSGVLFIGDGGMLLADYAKHVLLPEEKFKDFKRPPESIPPPHPEIAPASMTAAYEYGPRGGMPAVKLTWHQGEEKPALLREGKIPKWDSGVLFIGDGGMLLADYAKHVLLPEEKFKDFKRPPESIPPSLGHHKEWIHACKTGAPTTCAFDYSGPLTEANHLGNVAYRIGKKLKWNASKLEAPNAPAVAQYIRREYRKGWKLV